MGKNITVIPAKVNGTSLVKNLDLQKKRVAAYCRVSTDQEEQLSSFEAQVNYYTSYINGNQDYVMAGIYADEGISGTSTKKREQFNKMIEDCMAGNIDLIVTKSISRFARNTLDCLKYVRQLKDSGVEIYFEKENIRTLDNQGETLLTILSSLAQDESRSISENSTWGIRRRFEQGRLFINATKFLGYDKNQNGNLVINEKQAKIVRRIYTEFLDGKGANRIARELERDRVQNWNGKAKWYENSIRKMLTNEKYMGDALLQKTYTVDFLNKKRAENTGQVPQYYVEDSHPAIIEKEMWEAVQLEMERRRNFSLKYRIQKLESATEYNPFAGRVICGSCGHAYGRKVWNSTDDRLRRIVWRCNGKYVVKGEKGCESQHIDDEILYQAFVDVFNAMIENKAYFIGKWQEGLKSDNLLKRYKSKQFIESVLSRQKIDEFDIDLYFALVEKITVVGKKQVIVSLLDGTEIECDATSL